MLAQGGMTPMEALAAATINPARSLGLDRELGSLEAGKLADLVVLDRNPLENIRNTDSVSMVMVNGRLYDAATLNESRQRAPASEDPCTGNGRRQESRSWIEPGTDLSPDPPDRDSDPGLRTPHSGLDGLRTSHSGRRTPDVALRTPNGLRTPDVALRTPFVIYWTSSVGYMTSPCATPQRIQDQSVLHTIGNTPLLRLAAIDQGLDGRGALRQGGVAESRRVGQGSGGRPDGLRSAGTRPAAGRPAAAGCDVGQHRHRLRDDRRGARLRRHACACRRTSRPNGAGSSPPTAPS